MLTSVTAIALEVLTLVPNQRESRTVGVQFPAASSASSATDKAKLFRAKVVRNFEHSTKLFFTMKELCQLTGYKKSFVAARVKAGSLKKEKSGNSARYFREDVIDWLVEMFGED